jgi:pimeloyl-ACP methyl ester carboxylesterase
MTGPFDNGTLTNDLTALLDTLGIGRVNLLGWSMGGNEISEFAVRHPERTAGLIYLDAAYDWADPALHQTRRLLTVG